MSFHGSDIRFWACIFQIVRSRLDLSFVNRDREKLQKRLQQLSPASVASPVAHSRLDLSFVTRTPGRIFLNKNAHWARAFAKKIFGQSCFRWVLPICFPNLKYIPDAHFFFGLDIFFRPPPPHFLSIVSNCFVIVVQITRATSK